MTATRPFPHGFLFALVLLAATTARAQDDGDLDPRWGAGGIARLAAPSAQGPVDVACAPDASCYVTYATNSNGFGVHRILPAGNFSNSSTAQFDLGDANVDAPFSLTVGADGKPVVAGLATDASAETQVAVARFSAALATGLDPSFSGDGKATQNFAGAAIANAVAVGPSGETVVAGCYDTGGTAGLDFVVVRLLPNGNPDNGFDGNGVRTIDFGLNTSGPSDDCAFAVAIQPDGRIVVAGSAAYSFGDYDFAIARFTLTGALDPAFSPGGQVGAGMHTVGFDLADTDADEAKAVAVDRFGRIVLAGSADTGSNVSPAIARLTPTGELDLEFDSDGKYVHPSQSGEALGVVVLPAPSQQVLYLTPFNLNALTDEGDIDIGFGFNGAVDFHDPGAVVTGDALSLTLIGGLPVALGTSASGFTTSYVLARYWMGQIFGDDFESGNLNGWIGW